MFVCFLDVWLMCNWVTGSLAKVSRCCIFAWLIEGNWVMRSVDETSEEKQH